MKRFRRFATLMLAIIMAASTAVIPSYAESDIQYSESDLHELIDYDMAVDAGHVNRLNDEEDLNTLIFANEDNTKTMYFYGEDIKYTDEFGVVRDKTNKLTSTATGYTPFKGDVVYARNEATDGRGKFVVIKCTEPGVYKYSNSQKSIYVVLMHLQSIPDSLPTSVERGTIVGYVGDSGIEGSVHLHMEFLYLTGNDSNNNYYSSFNNTIDPLKFYNDQLIEFD